MCIFRTLARPHPKIDMLLDNCILLKINHPTCDKRKQINKTKSKDRYVRMHKGNTIKIK